MPKKNHKGGGKYGGSHTTYIVAAKDLLRAAERSSAVDRIVLSYITKRRSSGHGVQSVKIHEDNGCLLLVVRGNATTQEIRIYTRDAQVATRDIASTARRVGMRIFSS